ncbi:MAG: DUF4221 family protein [Bacteroidales bacterium]|nr:DUF4221 family protein [Bacteroidales bacterium]
MNIYSKKHILKFIIIIIFYNTIGCEGQSVSSNFNKKSKVKIEEIFSQSLQQGSFFSSSGKNLICWSPGNNIIKKYDIKKRKFYDEYKTEIKDSKQYIDFANIGKDSLVFFHWMDNYTMYLTYRGKIIKTYNLTPKKSENILSCIKSGHPTCNLDGTDRNTLIGDYFYFSAYKMGEKFIDKLYSGGKINLKTGKFEYFTEFPEIYRNYNWGAMRYYFPYITINKLKQIVVSYPACHDIFVYDTKKGTKKRIKSGSSLFKTIKPYSDKKEIVLELKSEYMKYYEQNYAYGDISYDRRRKLYYRLAVFPNINYGKSSDNTRKKSLIVLDKNFKFIGEVVLPTDKNYHNLTDTDYELVVIYYDFSKSTYGFTLFKINIL